MNRSGPGAGAGRGPRRARPARASWSSGSCWRWPSLVAVAVLVLFRPQLAWVLSLIGSEVDKSGWLLLGLALA